MNKLYFSFLSLCMGMPLSAADFSGSIAHVSNDNNTIIVTELPVESYYTAYMTMTLDVAAIQTYISKSSGNSYSGMSASLSISEPAGASLVLPSLNPQLLLCPCWHYPAWLPAAAERSNTLAPCASPNDEVRIFIFPNVTFPIPLH